ncbi:MAG: hydroxymethylglutaryl-CoA synthase [Candidatus Micrarchaeia archaeon]
MYAEEFNELVRDNSKNHRSKGIGIVGISRYVSLFLPASEKAKVIEGVNDIKNETDKIILGLGFTGYSIANVGETAITAAAIAIVKLAIQYNIDLSRIKNLWYSTETPSSLAANDAVAVRDAVNKIGKILREKGIADIGFLEPEDLRHNQSACVSGVESVFSTSAVGNISGDTIVATSDVAYYKWGTKEDETGGYGSTATLISSINYNTPALRITEYRGSSQGDHPDFDKRILKNSDERSGIAKVAKYPIVFGEYSNIKYEFNAFVAIEKALNSKGIDINDKSFFDKIVFASHTPYPIMPKKALANFMIHFMRTDTEFRERMFADIGKVLARDPKLNSKYNGRVEIPYINGFDTQRETFEFILDVEGLVLKLKEEAEAKKLSGNNESKYELDKAVSKAKSLLDYLSDYREKFNIEQGSELDKLFETAEAKLREMTVKGGTLHELIGAFSEIDTYINAYMERDSALNSIIRKTDIYNDIAKKMNVDESIKLSKNTGNLYTGSAFQSLMSLISYSDPEKLEGRYILFIGFGSQEGAYAILLEPQNIKELAATMKAQVEYEEGQRNSITAGEYRKIRIEGEFERIKPIISDTGEILQNNLFSVDKNKVAEYFKGFNSVVKESEVSRASNRAKVF